MSVYVYVYIDKNKDKICTSGIFVGIFRKSPGISKVIVIIIGGDTLTCYRN